jgi:hypothetical protein
MASVSRPSGVILWIARMLSDFLKIGPRIFVAPVIHGSGDFAVEVRRIMLAQKFDCLAVPLPPSFQAAIETAIESLPSVTVVIQEEDRSYSDGEWTPESEQSEEETDARRSSYVPIDPCQPVIAALRIARQQRMRGAFIDLETDNFEPAGAMLPDAYALKKVAIDRFAAAVLPAIQQPASAQHIQRVRHMAARLRELEAKHKSILLVCSVTDWPWIRDAYQEQAEVDDEAVSVEDPQIYRVAPQTLLFLLGELPFIVGLYERARQDLEDDENLSIDGIKELLLTSRDRYKADLKKRARRISPQLLSTYLKYVRNLSLIERRFTPDLYTLIVAAQQMAGDQFAIHLAETARDYPYTDYLPYDEIEMSIGRGKLPDGSITEMKSRLPGPPVVWRTCQLNRRPPKIDQEKWQTLWNPFRQCSWPPEDVAIERFRTHVKDHALNILGHDLARVEKFSTSLKDGLDIRETLRNWHTGDLYVKVMPPSKGNLDCVLMLFDTPADPRDYPWRITWHAESHDESTLSFYASHYRGEIVGPGIAQAIYGGAMFLFPPRDVYDIWRDSRFDSADTLEERLLLASFHYSTEKHIAVLSESAPGILWRRLAKKAGKRLVHVPLSHFSQETIQQLRVFHVLNGQQVRSYAEHFIRKG